MSNNLLGMYLMIREMAGLLYSYLILYIARYNPQKSILYKYNIGIKSIISCINQFGILVTVFAYYCTLG